MGAGIMLNQGTWTVPECRWEANVDTILTAESLHTAVVIHMQFQGCHSQSTVSWLPVF